MAYSPKYTLSDKLKTNLKKLSELKVFIENSAPYEALLEYFKKEYIIQNTWSSLTIEGNSITTEEVSAVLGNNNSGDSSKDISAFINALQSFNELCGWEKFTPGIILGVYEAVAGIKTFVRNKQVFVGRTIYANGKPKTFVEYMPPVPEDVDALLTEFCEWLNLPDGKDLDPVILSGIVNFEIARVHPFNDNNGKIARLFALLFLYGTGFDEDQIFVLNDYRHKARASFYGMIKLAQKKDFDMTEWLEFFSDDLLNSLEKIAEKIKETAAQNPEPETPLEAVPAVDETPDDKSNLSPRQKEIVQKIKETGQISNQQLRSVLDLSRQMVLKEVTKLINAGLVEISGKGRGAVYKLTEAGKAVNIEVF